MRSFIAGSILGVVTSFFFLPKSGKTMTSIGKRVIDNLGKGTGFLKK